MGIKKILGADGQSDMLYRSLDLTINHHGAFGPDLSAGFLMRKDSTVAREAENGQR